MLLKNNRMQLINCFLTNKSFSSSLMECYNNNNNNNKNNNKNNQSIYIQRPCSKALKVCNIEYDMLTLSVKYDRPTLYRQPLDRTPRLLATGRIHSQIWCKTNICTGS